MKKHFNHLIQDPTSSWQHTYRNARSSWWVKQQIWQNTKHEEANWINGADVIDPRAKKTGQKSAGSGAWGMGSVTKTIAKLLKIQHVAFVRLIGYRTVGNCKWRYVNFENCARFRFEKSAKG